jgi:outer membrane protein TolC
MRYWFVFALSIVIGIPFAKAQQNVEVSGILASEDAFVQWVVANHPMALEANLLAIEANAQILEAKGGFDPKLYADWDQKSFDEKNYFSIGDAGVKLPSWYGLEFKAGYLLSNGVFLNPENSIPSVGQGVAEIKWTLLQGLLMDERRANLAKADMQLNINDAKRISNLNKLLVDALDNYWDWVIITEQRQIQEQALQNARLRLEGTVESFIEGDKPGIDTIEAYIQVQNRVADLNKIQTYEGNARILLSNFLWLKGQRMLEVDDQVEAVDLEAQEEIIPMQEVANLRALLDVLHPDIRQIQGKLQQLDVDRKLAREQFKPQLDVSYAFLSGGEDFFYNTSDANPALWDLFSQNYKWNLTFSFPLFLRKARGKMEQIEVKTLRNNYKLVEKRRTIDNKINTLMSELTLAKTQIDLYTEMVGNYQRLFEAEQFKFQLGESSVFLINSREQKLLEAQLKLVDLKGDFHKKKAKLLYAAGLLAD